MRHCLYRWFVLFAVLVSTCLLMPSIAPAGDPRVVPDPIQAPPAPSPAPLLTWNDPSLQKRSAPADSMQALLTWNDPSLQKSGRHPSGFWLAFYDTNQTGAHDLVVFGYSRAAVVGFPDSHALAYAQGGRVYYDGFEDGVNGNEEPLSVLPTIPGILAVLHGLAPPHLRVSHP